MRCTGIPGSDLFKMHKMHMLNMLKYTESTKGMTEPVDKNRLHLQSDLEDSV